MPSYTINFNGGTCDAFGYLLVQPFRYTAVGLNLLVDHAKLIVGLHWINPVTADHPSFSTGLASPSPITIVDDAGNQVLNSPNMRALSIVSSQSVDVATTYWLLNGMAGSPITFSPLPAYAPPPSSKTYHPWQASLTGGGANLTVTYAECVYDHQRQNTLTDFVVIGPANSAGQGNSIVAAVMGAPTGAALPQMTFQDTSRANTTEFFGNAAAAANQTANTTGAIFAFNGLFKRGRPSDLIQLVHNVVRSVHPPQAGQTNFGRPSLQDSLPGWLDNPVFSGAAQNLEQAGFPSGITHDSLSMSGSDYEGLWLGNLAERTGVAQALML